MGVSVWAEIDYVDTIYAMSAHYVAVQLTFA
jgi:hypothetical protein